MFLIKCFILQSITKRQTICQAKKTDMMSLILYTPK